MIPADWEVRPLLAAVHIANGQVDPKQEPYKSMILVAPDHIERATGRLLDKKTAAEQKAISGKYAFEKGDIIYSKIRPYLRKAVLANFDGLCSADMYPLKPAIDVSGRFMLSVILGHRFSKYAESVSVRSGMPKINREELAEYFFALPPLSEQNAVSSVLLDTDVLIEKLEKLLQKKKLIKQGAMQELLTGKRRLPGFSGEWERKTIEELEKMNIIKLSRGKVISKKDIEKFAGDFPIYSSSIHNNGEFGRYGLYMFDEELVTWSVDGGGNFFYRNKHKFSVTNVCGYIRTNTEYLNYRYLAFQLQFLHGKLFFDYTMKAHPSVIRRAYSVSLPKLPEQIAIATALSDIDTEIENLESRLTKYQNLKQGMMQVLLTGKIRLI